MTEVDNTGKAESSTVKDPQIQWGTMRINREELLVEDTTLIPDLQDRAFKDFFKALASAPHIQGLAFSRTKLGGIYTNIFVRNFTDGKANARVLDVTDDAFELLAEAVDQPTGSHDYVSTEQDDINEFVEWFKEEFYKPGEIVEEDKDLETKDILFGRVRGSSEEMSLVRLVVFED